MKLKDDQVDFEVPSNDVPEAKNTSVIGSIMPIGFNDLPKIKSSDSEL